MFYYPWQTRRLGSRCLEHTLSFGMSNISSLQMSALEPAETARENARRRVLKSGVIAYSGRQVTLKCAVRDLSDSGARLLVEGSIAAPDTFELLCEIDGMSVDCIVVWRRGLEIGVRFAAPPVYTDKRRLQVVDRWSQTTAKPTLRRQPKTP